MPDESLNRQPIGPERQLPAVASKPRQSKGVKLTVWIIILLIFAAGFWLVLRQKEDQAKNAAAPRRGAGGPVAVNTVNARQGDIGSYLDAIGTVTPVYTASITSQVNGIITEVHYREGQVVRRGDPLIEIDPRPYRATLMQAQGTLERDQNVLAQAKMDAQRYRDAWARNAIPKQTLDDQEKIVLQDQGTVKNDEGTVQYDQVQLDYCHITAPITGRVGLRLVDPGNVVQANGTHHSRRRHPGAAHHRHLHRAGRQPGRGRASPQAQRPPRRRRHLTGPARTKIAEGTLLTLDNQIDTTTGTVKARATFANRDNALFPNQFVNARLLVDTLHGVTLIPTSAIQHNGTASFVYVLEDNVAHMRPVKPGVTDGGTTQVTGITPGDIVANSSFDKLQDNAKVNVTGKPMPASTVGSSAP